MKACLRYCAYGLFLLHATLGNAADLDVSVENGPTSGALVFMLFDSDESFDGFRTPTTTVAVQVGTQAVYRISAGAAGQYALLVYHDENANNQLDRNFIGIPKEPVGFSNGYRPKGPPSFRKAAVPVFEGKANRMTVSLSRPLGKRGRVGIGVGAIGGSSPYSNAQHGPIQFIPAITYIGERVQILGPYAQAGIAGHGDIRLAATLAYRLGSYEESDSPILEGLGDREATAMVGLALEWELASRLDLSLALAHDLLGRLEGSTAQLGIRRPFSLGAVRLSPSLALDWESSAIANHDFGVPATCATETRPAYRLGDTISIQAGMGCFIELSDNWKAILNLKIVLLDNAVTQSPIVSEDYVLKGFAALNVVL